MTTIIISDTHLTTRFNQRKFDYLKKVLFLADRIIINGDFWDGYMTTFDEFIKSGWNRLFPILKAKKTIYIFGNHDHKDKNDHRANLFSDLQVEKFELEIGPKKVLLTHGNKISPVITDRFPILASRKFPLQILQLLNYLAVLILGKKFYFINQWRNRKMKKWIEKNLSHNYYLICGHSHMAEINPSFRFANTGFIRYGYGHYLKISNGNIKLIEERY